MKEIMKHINEIWDGGGNREGHYGERGGHDGREGRGFGRRGFDPSLHGERGHGERRGHRGFGRHGFGRRGAEDGEGRGRRRMFEGGELRLVMLLLMEAEPRHGYDIIREIETRTGGAYAPSPGVIYPTLTLLEEIGQVETRPSEGAKKLHAITPEGKAHLAANRAEAEAALARLDALGRRDEALEAAPLKRAMTNLRVALQNRLSGGADKTLLFAVADAIDEAARKIERL
jgi:DNA-binding PadR family transcriptional regulator